MRAILHETLLGATGKKRYRFYKDIADVPFKSRAEIEALQLDKLRRMLFHAARHVPYYRDLFQSVRFDPKDVHSTADLGRLPTLDRGTVRAHTEAMVAANFDRSKLQRWSTGGSTGEPVHFYKEEDCIEMEIALMWRSWSWAGWSPPEKMVWIWGAPQETGQLDSAAGSIKWWLGGRLLLDAFDMGAANLDRWVEQINAFGAEHVIGYATSLTTFARHLERNNIRLEPRFKQVVSTAERLRPEQREIIGRAFGAPVFDQYGSREIRITAFESAPGAMHIIADSCVMEFIEDERLPEGSKRIVVTALNNFAMPLIRYEVGDCGAAQEGDGAGRIHFPTMKLDVGRVTDNFILPNGRVVHGEYYTHLMYGIDGVRSFQFRQSEPALIRLIVVPEDGQDRAQLESRLAYVRSESEKLDPAVRLVIEFTSAIPPTRSGKHLFTVCEIGQI